MEVGIFVDGGCLNGGPGAYAAVVVSPQCEVIIEAAHPIPGRCTNNVAEYHGLLLGCQLARLVGAQRPHFYSDSRLIVEQVCGRWDTREEALLPLRGRARGLLELVGDWTLEHVYREHNRRADWLCNELLDHKAKHQPTQAPAAEFEPRRYRRTP